MSVGYMRRCTGKRQHPDQDSAERHRSQLISSGKTTKNKSNTYRCDQCLSWHVGGIRRRPRGKR